MSNNTPTPTSDKTKASGSSGDSDFSLQVGASILDRYVVKSLLGKGGMGSVFHVRDEHLNTDYALKVLSQKGQESLWKRFENEARAASKLDHPNLIRVYESGLLPDGNPYFIMELVHGESLSDLLKRTGRLPITKALKIFIQVGFALSYAHEIGVIHRDLKTSNIMLANSEGTSVGTIKVVDLGIAKLTGRDDFNQQTLTKTGEILGSPFYMSPEQCLGVIVDKRSDLYSFGCALFETLTGAPPLIGDCALSTMMKHQSERPVSLREASLGISFPKSLEALIARLLEKDPDARYSSAQLVTAELVRIEHEIQDIEISRNEKPLRVATATKTPSISNSVTWEVIARNSIPFLTFALGIAVTTLFQNSNQSQQNDLESQNKQSASKPLIFPINPHPSQSQPISVQKTELLSSTKYFSTLDKVRKLRIFNFGPQDGDGYGKIWQDGEKFSNARGIITFAIDAPICFAPSPKLFETPEVFSKFRTDDLVGLELNDEMTSNFEIVTMLPRFTRLQYLRVEMNVDDSYLKYIDALPNLTRLNVSNSRITCGALMKLKRFQQFEYLGCANLDGKEQILSHLANLKIETFIIEAVDLSEFDFKRIAQLRTLKSLYIGGNARIDDNALRHIANHPNLVDLDLRGTSITVGCLPTLASLKHLKNLRLSKGQLPAGDIALLEEGLKRKGLNSFSVKIEKVEDSLHHLR